jgi:hypothetical protein
VPRVTQAITKYFPAGTKVTRPTGGYVLWVELPSQINSLELFLKGARGENKHRAWPDFLGEAEAPELHSPELWRAVVGGDGPGAAEARPTQFQADVNSGRWQWPYLQALSRSTHSHRHDYIEKWAVYLDHAGAKFVGQFQENFVVVQCL